jgi:hypothetical protein
LLLGRVGAQVESQGAAGPHMTKINWCPLLAKSGH